MSYVDGYVIPVPEANFDKYGSMAKTMAGLMKENGALKVVESWADDVPEGKVTSFTMAVKREAHEKVVFSFVIWPSKEVRDVGMKKVMEDPRMQQDMSQMPFDGQRMIWGGFKPFVEL